MPNWLLTIGGFALKLFTGSNPLESIFKSIDGVVDNETERRRIKADAVKHYVSEAETTRRTAMQNKWFWYVWTLYAGSTGLWWAAVMLDTAIPFVSWGIPDLPQSVQPKADLIFASIFGSGGAVGAAQAFSSAIRGRR